MTQKTWVITAVVVGIVVVWLLARGGAPQETPPPGAGNDPFAVIYDCADEEVFVLQVQSDGTGRALSTAHEETALIQDDLTKAWESDDGVVSIYQTAGYTVVVEDGVMTHTECRPQ